MTTLVAAAGVAAALGATVQSATGVGFSLVAAPLMFAAFEPEEAVGLLMLLGLEVNLLTIATERRRPRPLASEAAVILAFALPGAIAGVAVLRSLDEVVLQVAVSAGVLATLATRRLRPRRDAVPRWAAPAVGALVGVLTTTTTTAGPPLMAYLLGRGLPAGRVRDTLTVVFLGLGLIGAAALILTGTDSAIPPPLTALAVMAPLVAAGHLAGRPVFARLEERAYEPVVTSVLVVAVGTGLLTALL
jgi:uncharacterized membrane protein YfcA